MALSYFSLVRGLKAAKYLTLTLLGSRNVPTKYRKSLRSVFALLVTGALANRTKFVTGPTFVGSSLGRVIVTRYAVTAGVISRFVVQGRFRARAKVTVRNVLRPKNVAVVGYTKRYLSRCFISANRLVRGAGCVGTYHARTEVGLSGPMSCFVHGPLNGRRVVLVNSRRGIVRRFVRLGDYGLIRWKGRRRVGWGKEQELGGLCLYVRFGVRWGGGLL